MGMNGVEAGLGSIPTTSQSLVLQLSSNDERRIESIGRLFTLYHGAILAHLRLTWRKLSFEEIEDRGSAFFASLLEKDAFKGFDPLKARFRTFLKMLLDRFARDANDGATAQFRGGGVKHVSYHGDKANLLELIADHDSLTPAEMLDEVIRHDFLSRATDKTRAWAEVTGRSKQFEAFRLYSLEPEEGATYLSVAERLGVKESDVRNHISGMRKRLKMELHELLKPTVGDPEKDLPEEFRELYG
jgi:DNA-directed RNA polymerase specialized sigma24 family protein